ncbi:MAG TPA: Ig-like domain-containing protein [Chitinophagales bacterium]|nr:Ig-like domain-containing protein [Chitinophagales bacterium]
MILRCCFCFLVIALLAACASQIPPTGGPKDIMPPTVTKENPKNLSTNFQATKINITFSEFVQLNDATNQIFFSPALEGKVIYHLHRKTLTIVLPDTLRANTTYTVNFGSAVKDITEGNIMLSYQYVFSTGAAIDSFRIAGKVSTVLDGKSKPNILVMLYRDANDSVVAQRRPDYNARTDSSGNFILSHLAQGNYKLFALDDQDFNMLYNQPGESVAFLDSNIFIHDTSAIYKLSMFRQQAEKQSVLGAFSRQPGKAVIVFAKRAQHLRITPLEDSLSIVTEHNATNDTITCWVNDLKSDSIAFTLHDDDFDDTVKVRMKIGGKKQQTSGAKFFVSAISQSGRGVAQLKKGDALVLDFSSPVIDRDKNRKISLTEDSSKKEIAVVPEFFSDSITGRKKASINFPFRQEVKYTLLIPDSAFKDFSGNYNDSTKIQVKILSEEEMGNLIIHLSFTDSVSSTSFYYELRNKDGMLMAKKAIKARNVALPFDGLLPGNFSFRVYEDRNNNFQWYSGNYWKHSQPEKIFFYIGVINIRANWDVDVNMKIDNR